MYYAVPILLTAAGFAVVVADSNRPKADSVFARYPRAGKMGTGTWAALWGAHIIAYRRRLSEDTARWNEKWRLPRSALDTPRGLLAVGIVAGAGGAALFLWGLLGP
jgi:hypothetical protein